MNIFSNTVNGYAKFTHAVLFSAGYEVNESTRCIGQAVINAILACAAKTAWQITLRGFFQAIDRRNHHGCTGTRHITPRFRSIGQPHSSYFGNPDKNEDAPLCVIPFPSQPVVVYPTCSTPLSAFLVYRTTCQSLEYSQTHYDKHPKN